MPAGEPSINQFADRRGPFGGDATMTADEVGGGAPTFATIAERCRQGEPSLGIQRALHGSADEEALEAARRAVPEDVWLRVLRKSML